MRSGSVAQRGCAATCTVAGALTPYFSAEATTWQVAGVGGAVYTPDGVIDPQPDASSMDHVTVVSAAPVTVAEKVTWPEGAVIALGGRMSTAAPAAAGVPVPPAAQAVSPKAQATRVARTSCRLDRMGGRLSNGAGGELNWRCKWYVGPAQRG